MFTGLIECVGTVLSVSSERGGTYRMEIAAAKIAGELKVGESVAVSGACLTVVAANAESFSTQMMQSTLDSTKLGALKPGTHVNLERALSLSSRLDGHIVQGHVDGVAKVLRIETASGSANTKKFRLSIPPDLAWGIAAKGSVTLDGISLTVIDSGRAEFSVGLIPATLRATTAGDLRPGDDVNIEIDVLARYIARMMQYSPPPGGADGAVAPALTRERLEEIGWS